VSAQEFEVIARGVAHGACDQVGEVAGAAGAQVEGAVIAEDLGRGEAREGRDAQPVAVALAVGEGRARRVVVGGDDARVEVAVAGRPAARGIAGAVVDRNDAVGARRVAALVEVRVLDVVGVAAVEAVVGDLDDRVARRVGREALAAEPAQVARAARHGAAAAALQVAGDDLALALVAGAGLG
jgi:hypothetical protein